MQLPHRVVKWPEISVTPLSREQIDRNKNPRQIRQARSFLQKERPGAHRLEDLADEINFLKVDGREIKCLGEENKVRTRAKHNTEVKLPPKDFPQKLATVLLRDRLIKGKMAFERKEEQPAEVIRSQPALLMSELNRQKENATKVENMLPQIPRTTCGSNKKHSIKASPERGRGEFESSLKKIDKGSSSVSKWKKRRDTVPQTVVRNEESSVKAQQQSKKQALFSQYRQFLLTISLTNRIYMAPEEEGSYKAYICKGNNGLLVKSIFKTRPWWSFRNSSEIESCHFVWTEWKRNKSMATLTPTKQLTVEALGSQPIVNCNGKEREKKEKKLANYANVIGKHSNLITKYDSNPSNHTYLSYSTKINSKQFQEVIEKQAGKDVLSKPKAQDRKLVNHVPGCLYLHSKKLLFLYMSNHYRRLNRDVFDVIPLTFHIKAPNDTEFARFTAYHNELAKDSKNGRACSNVWICKPGENSNRGHGIEVASTLGEIRSLVGQRCGGGRSMIVQKYMENPLLYNRRKFDIRCFVLLTCVNGAIKGYWYQDGYVRTASKEFTLKNLENRLIHLTNDAVQKKGEDFGKYQNCNKVTFSEFEKYLQANGHPGKYRTAYQGMKDIATDLMLSVAHKINHGHKEFCFELFGLDFMLDDKCTPYLIEANSNPCLEVDGNVLGRIIPPLIENVIRVAIDPIFSPPLSHSFGRFTPGNSFQVNRMTLVYDSLFDTGDPEPQGENNDAECEEFEGEVDQD